MIVVVHDTLQIKQVTLNEKEFTYNSNNIVEEIVVLAQKFPDENILWINEKLLDFINWNYISSFKIKSNEIHSFATSNPFLPNALGYVNQNALLKIPKNVIFQTWQMSTDIGIISASLLLKVQPYLEVKNSNFGFFINAITQRFLISGLFSYSNPNFLKPEYTKINSSGKTKDLFVFVKQHYNFKWLMILFFSILIFERKAYFHLVFLVLFNKKLPIISLDLFKSLENDTKTKYDVTTIDVIVPTIGRSKYAYEVINCLKKQTKLPKRVIVVEQNPLIDSKSELEWIKNESWPFEIIFNFTHQAGACNARNIALSYVKSDWVFLCDDDNVFDENVIADSLNIALNNNLQVVSLAYPQEGEVIKFDKAHQTTIFGSGNSIVKYSLLKNVSFDSNYEFCYGEDYDFGMQLRYHGADVVYLPNPYIIHLKAPIGGFRTKPILPWHNEPIQPKPAPTILLNQLKYKTIEQYRAYKLVYFIKEATWTDWATFFYSKRKKWAVSLRWANLLLNKSI